MMAKGKWRRWGANGEKERRAKIEELIRKLPFENPLHFKYELKYRKYFRIFT
jgi:hypothetical protein